MHGVAHALGVVLGGPVYAEVATRTKNPIQVLSALYQVARRFFHNESGNRVNFRFPINKRYAVFLALTLTHVSLFISTFVYVFHQYTDDGVSEVLNLHVLLTVIAIWTIWGAGEVRIIKDINQRFPRGASRLPAGGLVSPPTSWSRPMERGQSNPDKVGEQDEHQEEDFLAWLSVQPKAKELVAIAEKRFQDPGDLEKMAAKRQKEYEKVWGKKQSSESDEFQPLTR